MGLDLNALLTARVFNQELKQSDAQKSNTFANLIQIDLVKLRRLQLSIFLL